VTAKLTTYIRKLNEKKKSRSYNLSKC